MIRTKLAIIQANNVRMDDTKMKESDHLTKSEIAAFTDKTLSAEKHRLVGGHLLRCIACRKLLPMPTTEEFFTALLEESDRSGDGEKD